MGGSYFGRNMDGGRLVIIGFLGGAMEKVYLLAVAAKRVIVSGSMLRPRTAAEKAAIADVLYKKVWPILSAGRCLPIIYKVFPLLSAADAHRRMEAGDHIGKIVLKVAE